MPPDSLIDKPLGIPPIQPERNMQCAQRVLKGNNKIFQVVGTEDVIGLKKEANRHGRPPRQNLLARAGNELAIKIPKSMICKKRALTLFRTGA